MKLDEYQTLAKGTKVAEGLMYTGLALAGEAGEVAKHGVDLRHLAVLLHERQRLGVPVLGFGGVAAKECDRLRAARQQRHLRLPVVGSVRHRGAYGEEVVGELDGRVVPAPRV